MFIDQLAMIQEKTRGNLSTEEGNVLRNALSNLQMAFVEVAQGGGAACPGGRAAGPADEPGSRPKTRLPALRPFRPPARPKPPRDADAGESKKRFSKSYGS